MNDEIDFQNLPATMTPNEVKMLFLQKDMKEIKKFVHDDLSEIKAQNTVLLRQLPEVQSSSTRNHEALEHLRKEIMERDKKSGEMLTNMDSRLTYIERQIEKNKISDDARNKALNPIWKWLWNGLDVITKVAITLLITYLLTKK